MPNYRQKKTYSAYTKVGLHPALAILYSACKLSFKLALGEEYQIQINSQQNFVKKYNNPPLSPELSDLCRLHNLVRNRKVTTILDYGVGKSTLVFDDALKKNYREFEKFIVKEKMIRRSNKFECHTIDDQAKWINNIKKNYRTRCSALLKTSKENKIK